MGNLLQGLPVVVVHLDDILVTGATKRGTLKYIGESSQSIGNIGT